MLIISACAPTSTAPTAPDEPQRVTATDGATGILAVTIPADWESIQERNHTLSVARDDGAMRRFAGGLTALRDDDVAGTVSALRRDALTANIADTPSGVLDHVMGILSDEAENGVLYTFGTETTRTYGDLNGAMVDALATNDDALALDVRVIVVQTDAAYGILIVGAPAFILEETVAVWDEIAASFSFRAIDD